MDQTGQLNVVALAEAAVVVDQELGHDKQRDALGTGRCVGQLGQHQVHDVLAQLVVTGGDKDLVATDAVGAVVLRDRAGLDVTQRGAGVRLGQAHGAEEAAGHHRLGVTPLLLVGAVRHDQVAGGDGQTGVSLGTDVGAFDQADTGLGYGSRQLHAAALVVLRGGHQAGITQHGQRLGDFRANHNLAILEARLVFIAQAVVRCKGLARDLQRQLDGGIKGIAAVVFVTRELGKALDIQHFIEQKRQIVGIDDFLGHGKFLWNF